MLLSELQARYKYNKIFCISLFQICKHLNDFFFFFLRFKMNKFILFLLDLLFSPHILDQIGLLLELCLYLKDQDIINMIIFKFILAGFKKNLGPKGSKFYFRRGKYIYIYIHSFFSFFFKAQLWEFIWTPWTVPTT